jgi:hypothetical protein
MITGRLDCWPLDNPPAYQALSYTSGNSMYVDDVHQRQNRNMEVHEIRVNDQAFFVQRNLHEALLSLRQVPLSRYLWIDAICINQIDIEEKNHQVGLMKHIYREARSVIAWLGPSDRHSSISLRLVNDVTLTDDHPLRLRIIKRALKHNFEAAYRDLFRRSYWHRTWIILEIHSARRIILQCGLDIVLWKDLVKFQKFLTDECSTWEPMISRDALKRVISSAKRFITLDTLRKSNPISRARRGKESRPRHLADLLLEYWDTLASNPRDKIFAIIGLASDSHLYDIDIDYRLSVCQIYTKFVMENIRLVGTLDIILLRRPQNPAHGLPSWCPDLSSTASDSGNMLGDTYPFWTSGRPYHASRIVGSDIDNEFTVHFSPNGEIMAASGWRLGRVSNHSDVASFRGFEPRKRGLFNCYGLLSLCRLVPSEAPIEPSEMDVWYTIHRQALRRGFNAELRKHLVNKSRRSYREYCAKKHDEFFRVIVRATSLEANEFIDSEILSDWRWHRDIPRNIDDRPNENMTPEMREVLRRLGHKNVHGGYRCFFVTSSGLMGLAPNETRKGDIVCVLRGCDMPVMLRATGVHFKLVGACYVVGFMHGQLYEYIQRSRIPVPEETFQIN